MLRKKKYLLLSALAAATCLLLSSNLKPNGMTSVLAVDVDSLGVYWDSGCTIHVESMEWGFIKPGDSVESTVHIRNEADKTVRLSMDTNGWDPPSASEQINLDWDYADTLLGSGEAMQTTMTLTVIPTITGIDDFSFVTIITASTVDVCLIADFDTCFVTNQDLRMIYPSDGAEKPLGCCAAAVSDWLSSAFFFVELQGVKEGLDTDGSFIDQATGVALGEPDTGVISLGGPSVNPIAMYAEAESTPLEDRAPIQFHSEGDVFYFRSRDGTDIPGASLPIGVINVDMDIFVIETYVDGGDRYILLSYGFGWKGTYAAGKYFNTVVHPNLESYTYSWIIVKWEDTNGDGFVNTEIDGDSYTLIASGF